MLELLLRLWPFILLKVPLHLLLELLATWHLLQLLSLLIQQLLSQLVPYQQPLSRPAQRQLSMLIQLPPFL